jgi:hypothetical protein
MNEACSRYKGFANCAKQNDKGASRFPDYGALFLFTQSLFFSLYTPALSRRCCLIHQPSLAPLV